jgi:hypothetical protein
MGDSLSTLRSYSQLAFLNLPDMKY